MNAQTESLSRPTGGARSVPRRGLEQPLDIIHVDGALLKLETLATLSGRVVSSLYLDARQGKLVLTKNGSRCTRVRAEDARAYLAKLAGASA
jgi:hypothetical protein